MEDVSYPDDLSNDEIRLLAQFAAAALTGMMAHPGRRDGSDISWDQAPAAEIAKRAFGIGLAMVLEHRKSTADRVPGVF